MVAFRNLKGIFVALSGITIGLLLVLLVVTSMRMSDDYAELLCETPLVHMLYTAITNFIMDLYYFIVINSLYYEIKESKGMTIP